MLKRIKPRKDEPIVTLKLLKKGQCLRYSHTISQELVLGIYGKMHESGDLQEEFSFSTWNRVAKKYHFSFRAFFCAKKPVGPFGNKTENGIFQTQVR